MMGSEVDETTDDPRELIGRAWVFFLRTLSFWRVPLAFLAVGSAAWAVFAMIRTPTYRSETVILYSEGVRTTDDSERPDTTRSVTMRLREILMSRVGLDAVAREFDLYPDVRRAQGPVDAVEELRKHIEFRAPGGDTFSIAFVGASPGEALRVTNRLTELVVAQDADLRKKQALVMRDFFESEKGTTEARLRNQEQDLATFMAAHPRFALDATPLATGAAIRASVGAVEGAVQGVPISQRWRVPNPSRDLSASTSTVAARPASGGARESVAEEGRAAAGLAAARTNLAELLTRFTPAHPDVRAAQAEVDRATSRLAAATVESASQRASTSSMTDRAVEKARPAAAPMVRYSVPTVTPSNATIQPPASGAPPAAERDVVTLETDWVRLTRSVTEARQHEDQVETALFKANIAANSESGGHGVQVTVIDPAFLPQNPVPPGRTTIALLFVAVSFVLGAAGAVLLAILDDRIHDDRDVSRFSEVLVEVPRGFARRAHVTS